MHRQDEKRTDAGNRFWANKTWLRAFFEFERLGAMAIAMNKPGGDAASLGKIDHRFSGSFTNCASGRILLCRSLAVESSFKTILPLKAILTGLLNGRRCGTTIGSGSHSRQPQLRQHLRQLIFSTVFSTRGPFRKSIDKAAARQWLAISS